MTDLKDKWMPLTRGEDGKPGYEFRIYAEDHKEGYPIFGAVLIDGGWHAQSWALDGSAGDPGHPTPCDLIPRPPTVWVNVYHYHSTKEHADAAEKYTTGMGDEARVACIEVPKTWED